MPSPWIRLSNEYLLKRTLVVVDGFEAPDYSKYSASPSIPLRHPKRVLDDHYFAVVGGNDDFDDVEAVADIVAVQHSQPGGGAAGDEFLFGAGDVGGGVGEVAGLTRLYLGED